MVGQKLAEIRQDVVSLREGLTEVRGEVTELRGELSDLRGELSDFRHEFVACRDHTASEFVAVRSDAVRLADTLRELIVEEGRTTRRHFDVVAENLKDSIRIIAEGLGVHTGRVENHEHRLQRLEQP